MQTAQRFHKASRTYNKRKTALQIFQVFQQILKKFCNLQEVYKKLFKAFTNISEIICRPLNLLFQRVSIIFVVSANYQDLS